MASKEAYKIMVGSRESKAYVGYLEMNQGNTITKGELLAAQPIGGFAIFPNRTVCWGRRIIANRKWSPEDAQVQPNDPAYRGEVKWMKWGEKGGMPIVARWKMGIGSLDYDYQVLQLQQPEFKDDEQGAYMQIPFGENSIFFDTEELKAKFLEIHHENSDSIYKSPNAEGGMWSEVKAFDTTKQEVKEVDLQFEAVKIIKEANTFEKLKVLKEILSAKKVISYNEGDENSLYDVLIIYAKGDPDFVIKTIQEYKNNVSKKFSYALSYKALDLTKDGHVALIQPEKKLLLSDIPAKGEDMLRWMEENSLLPEVHTAINTLIHLSEKFK